MSGRLVRVGCEFLQQCAHPTPAVMQVLPLQEDPVLLLEQAWRIDPHSEVHQYVDSYGNRCLRLVLPMGRSRFAFGGLVRVPDSTEEVDRDAPQIPPQRLPDHTLLYTLPSRYVLPEMLSAQDLSRFATARSGYERVSEVCRFVHQHLTFSYGTSTSTTTSHDAFRSGFGVCRDFTHLAIAFCRALDIPARYVFGYLPRIDVHNTPEAMDFAAWMEVWLGDRWWTFDPRNNMPRKGRILIGRGRDASDVAMMTAFGAPELLTMTVVAEEVASHPVHR